MLMDVPNRSIILHVHAARQYQRAAAHHTSQSHPTSDEFSNGTNPDKNYISQLNV